MCEPFPRAATAASSSRSCCGSASASSNTFAAETLADSELPSSARSIACQTLAGSTFSSRYLRRTSAGHGPGSASPAPEPTPSPAPACAPPAQDREQRTSRPRSRRTTGSVDRAGYSPCSGVPARSPYAPMIVLRTADDHLLAPSAVSDTAAWLSQKLAAGNALDTPAGTHRLEEKV